MRSRIGRRIFKNRNPKEAPRLSRRGHGWHPSGAQRRGGCRCGRSAEPPNLSLKLGLSSGNIGIRRGLPGLNRAIGSTPEL